MFNDHAKKIRRILLKSLKNENEIDSLLKKYEGREEIVLNILSETIEDLAEESNPFKYQPVTPHEFLTDPYFCGVNPKTGVGVCETLYPTLHDAFCEIHDLESPYREVILTGSIGWGKSFMMELGLLWNIYVLSCFKNPQKYFGLSPASKISVMVISITEKQSKKNIYSVVKEMVKVVPYFQEQFLYDDKRAADSLIFPRNVEFFNGTSAQSSAIGLNIYSAALDEANFFKKIENSKRAQESKGTFDEALTLYYSLEKRQESRFLKKGVQPGHLYVGSSKIYPNDFTAQRIKAAREAEMNGAKRTTYVMDYNVWKVNRSAYDKEEFQVEVGGLNRRSRILDGTEKDIVGEVISVPMNFLDKFQKDIDNALRDIAGVAVYTVQPFIGKKEAISKMFDASLKRIFSVDRATLSPKPEYLIIEKILKHIIEFPDRTRYIGIDIGLKKDRFGIAMGYIEDYVYVEKDYFDDIDQTMKKSKEKLPIVVIEMVLQVYPESEFGEVELSRVRYLIFQLRRFGYKIKYSSADGFQSADMQQILKRNGIAFDYISMDKTTEPYETFRTAMYEERIKCAYHEVLERELNELERNYAIDKIDHPVHGSKDLADAVGQVVYNIHINPHFSDMSLLPTSIDLSEATEKKEETYESIIEEFNNWSKK